MTGVNLHIVLEAPSAGWSPSAAEARAAHPSGTRRSATEPEPTPAERPPRLVEVMLALSGHMDVEEPAAEDAGACSSSATLERLAMLGISFGL